MTVEDLEKRECWIENTSRFVTNEYVENEEFYELSDLEWMAVPLC